MVIDKIQTRPTQTIKYELLIDTDFIDYSSIIRLANSQDERKALIEKGAENVFKQISQNPPSSPL